jgi:hypothetical protein
MTTDTVLLQNIQYLDDQLSHYQFQLENYKQIKSNLDGQQLIEMDILVQKYEDFINYTAALKSNNQSLLSTKILPFKRSQSAK